MHRTHAGHGSIWPAEAVEARASDQSTLTPERIAELRALLAKATPGSWEVDYLDKNGQRVIRQEHIEIATFWHHSVGSIEKEMEANAALVVAMRNALPDLLDAAERLERPYTGAISLASIDEGATRPETWKERAENRQAVFLLAKRRAEAAESEAAALREALRPFVSHYEPWMERQADGDRMCVYPVHTMGDLRRARSALEGRDNG